jgi:benzaldehyde dehydrogenase (NAD)
MVIGRHLVHESVYDEYVDKLAATADGLTVGNPATDDVDLGPIIDEHQRDLIHCLVTESVTAGATLRTGGTYDGSSTALRSWPAPVPAHPHTTTRSSAPSPQSSVSPRPAKPSTWRQTVSTDWT